MYTVCVYININQERKGRERERETRERQRDRETERQRDRETERQRDSERERESAGEGNVGHLVLRSASSRRVQGFKISPYPTCSRTGRGLPCSLNPEAQTLNSQPIHKIQTLTLHPPKLKNPRPETGSHEVRKHETEKVRG